MILIFWMMNFVLLTSCAVLNSNSSPKKLDYHVVKEGETLYDIARHHGLDYRKLVDWNHIDSPDTILPGKKIFFSPQPEPKPKPELKLPKPKPKPELKLPKPKPKPEPKPKPKPKPEPKPEPKPKPEPRPEPCDEFKC